MTRRQLTACALAAAVACAAAGAPALAGRGQAADPLSGSLQALLVLTEGWDAVDGTMQRFERASPTGQWRPAGPPVPVVVGRTGLAWGRGLTSPSGSGPVKREGDGKAPAGIFALSTAFGQSNEKPAGWRMPYRFLANDVECVDDAASSAYNRLTTKADAQGAPWSSSEKMWLEPLYKWGVVVDHNVPGTQAGGGSCIFLHIWKGPGRGTAGCTAMEEPALTAAIAWLLPESLPRLVQLPRAEYERLQQTWRLPVAK